MTFPFPVFVPVSTIGVASLAFHASATSTASTVVGPATIAAGDLLILLDSAFNKSGTPTAAVPPDFTTIGNQALERLRQIVSAKLATGEAGASLSGMSGTLVNNKSLLVLRGDVPITSVSIGSLHEEATADNPAAQTVGASAGSPPLVVIGCYGSNGVIDPRSMSPAKDNEISPSPNSFLAWKIYNSAPDNISVDMDDENTTNILQSFFIAVA